MPQCFGQFAIVKETGRLKHSCGSKACAQQNEFGAKCSTYYGNT